METLLQHSGAIASKWQSAIARTSYVAMERHEVHRRLTDLTERAVALLFAEEFDAEQAHQIGAGVASLGYMLPEALAATLEVLGFDLQRRVPAERQRELQARMIQLLSGVASGFSAQARATILADQESVRHALLTLRDQALDASRESEERFRAIFERAAIGMAVADLQGNLVQVNHALEHMLGYTAEEMRGRPFSDFSHPADVSSGIEPFVHLASGESDRYEMEQRFVHRNDSVVWANIAVSLVRDAEGRPQFAIAMGEDITQRKRGEAERLELFREQAARTEAEAAQRRLAFLADASRQLASSLDLDVTLERVARAAVPVLADWCTVNLVDASGALHNETTAHVNPVHEQLAKEMRQQYPRRQEVGRSPAMAVLTTRESRLIADVDDASLERISNDEQHLELWRRLAPRSVMIVPLVIHGRALGTLSLIATTASDRRYTEADLALAEDLGRRAAMAVENARLFARAEEAVRVRDEFLSVAAHELKTPVTSLRGFAQLTLRTIERTGHIDVGPLTRALTIVDQQSDKLTRLVAQLLDISRIQSGKLSLDCRQTNVSRMVLDLVHSMQTHSDRHDLRARVPADVHLHVDSLRLEQVLTNLLDNAIKYSPEGGPVDVELSAAEDRVWISVRDHGVGVPPQHREHIFERFYQVEASGGHTTGMGLGLYISHQIVDLHDGELQADFPDDGGARFVISLPKQAA